MAWLIIIIAGALIGWLASLIMKTDQQQEAIANVLIGIVGAALGRWLFSDILGLEGAVAAGQLSFAGLVWGIVGSVVLIGLLKSVHVLR